MMRCIMRARVGLLFLAVKQIYSTGVWRDNMGVRAGIPIIWEYALSVDFSVFPPVGHPRCWS